MKKRILKFVVGFAALLGALTVGLAQPAAATPTGNDMGNHVYSGYVPNGTSSDEWGMSTDANLVSTKFTVPTPDCTTGTGITTYTRFGDALFGSAGSASYYWPAIRLQCNSDGTSQWNAQEWFDYTPGSLDATFTCPTGTCPVSVGDQITIETWLSLDNSAFTCGSAGTYYVAISEEISDTTASWTQLHSERFSNGWSAPGYSWSDNDPLDQFDVTGGDTASCDEGNFIGTKFDDAYSATFGAFIGVSPSVAAVEAGTLDRLALWGTSADWKAHFANSLVQTGNADGNGGTASASGIGAIGTPGYPYYEDSFDSTIEAEPDAFSNSPTNSSFGVFDCVHSAAGTCPG